MKQSSLLGLVACAMSLASPAMAAEGDPAGGEFQVSTTSTVNNPDVAIDDSGNFVAVWQGAGGNLLMQRYDATGARQGTEVNANGGLTNAFTPRIARAANGTFAIVSAATGPGDADGIYLRLYDAGGVAQGSGPVLVNSTTAGVQSSPDIAMNASGSLIVAWRSADGAGASSIKAQRFDASGAAQGSELAVSANTVGTLGEPAAGIDDSGKFIVVWEADGDGDQTGIYGRRYSAAGAPLSGAVTLNSSTASAQTYPAVSVSGSGAHVVVWYTWNGANTIAQRFAADGSPVGTELIVSPAAVNFSGPDVAISDAGNFWVTWERMGAETGGSAFSFGVFGRRYLADGTANAPVQINSSIANNQDFVAVATDSDGDTVVVWQSAHMRSNLDVFAQRYAGASAAPPPDTTPDAFTFVDQTGVAANTVVTSSPITITGITAASQISVTGGTYSIGCGAAFASTAGTISNGQTVCVRHTSATANSTRTDTALTVGGVSDTFSSTTQAPPSDTTPDAFTFTTVTAAAPGSVQTSAPVTISGINAPSAISVTGGEYSIGCGTYTAVAGTVTNGQTVCVRHTAAAGNMVTTTTTLTVGGVSASFTSTTESRRGGGGAIKVGDAVMLWLLALGYWYSRRQYSPNTNYNIQPR